MTRPQPLPGAGQHFDAGEPPARGDGELDEMRDRLVATEDVPGARERIVKILARLLREPAEG